MYIAAVKQMHMDSRSFAETTQESHTAGRQNLAYHAILVSKRQKRVTKGAKDLIRRHLFMIYDVPPKAALIESS